MRGHVGEAAAIPVGDASRVGEARRAAAALSADLGFGPTDCGRVALAATEIANNLLRHARDGELLIRPVGGGVELLAVDRGPGMADVARCLRDGYTTGTTPGTGLGAVERAADLFDVYSAVPGGTALLARFWPRPASPPPEHLAVGVAARPAPGETLNGDTWADAECQGGSVFMVADGLGHGPYAAEASRLAARLLRENPGESPTALLERMHAALRPTRGAAVAIARVRFADGEVRFAGVGNIVAGIHEAGGVKHLVSSNGTVGHALRKVMEVAAVLPPAALLVMHSDGLTTSWRLDAHPGVVRRHPSLVAAVLYKHYLRGRDDATVLACRLAGGD